ASDPTENLGPAVVVVPLKGELTRGTAALIGRALDTALELDRVCVIELDTPGGRVDLMQQLGRRIEDARDAGVYVVAWVTEQAMSAGAYVAMSCDRIAMRDGTQIGAATPILAGPAGAAPVEGKMVSAMRAEFRSVAEQNGYPPAIAEGMVDGELVVVWVRIGDEDDPRAMTDDRFLEIRREVPGSRKLGRIGSEGQPIALTAGEAFDYGLAEQAEDVDDIREIVAPYVGSEAPRLVRIEPSGAEWLAHFLGTISPLLLIAGIALIWMEFQAPGLGAPAAGAAVCFGLLIAGRYIAGLAGIEHLVLIGLGLILIAVELFIVPGTLVAGILGGLALLGGLILSATGEIDPFSVELDRLVLIQTAFNTVVWLAVAAVVSMAMSWILPKTPVYSALAIGPTDAGETFGSALGPRAEARPRQDLVGRLGRATTALRPVGEVQVDGEGIVEFEANALDGPHEPGTRVRVVSTEGGRLRVERAPDQATEDPA
ncbi:MAG: NfeD family protein, partial [Planctomycetota bacterium]